MRKALDRPRRESDAALDGRARARLQDPYVLPAWGEACRQAGLDSLILHDLRRSAVRNLERGGVPRSIAMQLTGHLTEAVYRRYDIVDEQDLRDGAAKLARFLQPTEQPIVGAQPEDATS